MEEIMLTTLKQKVDPENAALIVVDVQNDFAANGGAFDRYLDCGDLQHGFARVKCRLVQRESRNSIGKLGTTGGANFRLDNPFAQEYFFIALSLSPL
jgi:hypothetical protein